ALRLLVQLEKRDHLLQDGILVRPLQSELDYVLREELPQFHISMSSGITGLDIKSDYNVEFLREPECKRMSRKCQSFAPPETWRVDTSRGPSSASGFFPISVE